MQLKQKIENTLSQFEAHASAEEKYHYLIELAKKTPKLQPKDKIEANKVLGCQSQTYLTCEKRQGKLFFTIDSDALISKGLATLLLQIYNGETKDTILSSPPHFLQKLNLASLLTPGRAGGVLAIYKKMCQEAIKM